MGGQNGTGVKKNGAEEESNSPPNLITPRVLSEGHTAYISLIMTNRAGGRGGAKIFIF